MACQAGGPVILFPNSKMLLKQVETADNVSQA